jgi:predicted HTH transcriptional regulator
MRIRVFISSVQKELADERMALQILLTTDPFLSSHCVPVLFEEVPAPLHPDQQAYLNLLRECQIYIAIIWKQYGNPVNGLSATHHEYRLARELKLPTLVTVKGDNHLDRDDETHAFLEEIRTDGHTYDRFMNTEELQEAVRNRLIKHIKDMYDLEPTSDQERSAHETIQVASLFERQRLDLMPWEDADIELATQIAAAAEESDPMEMTPDAARKALWQRGYLWRDDQNRYYVTAAGILLFSRDPSVCFVHARIQASSYGGDKRGPSPRDHATIRKPLSRAIDEAVAFVHKNTRHPLRVVGLRRVEVDEYPEEALREAMVNALAHRDYEDVSRRILLEVYTDRLEIISPGGLPGTLTLARLRAGKARSRSRNPGIAQGLAFLDRMEERGTGIQRMQDAMLDHGLDKPLIEVVDNEVIVTLRGPGDNFDLIRTPNTSGGGLEPSIEAKLNERQRAILEEVVANGSVSTGWCTKAFGVVKDTAVRDLNELVELGLFEPRGRGRGRHYVLKP